MTSTDPQASPSPAALSSRAQLSALPTELKQSIVDLLHAPYRRDTLLTGLEDARELTSEYPRSARVVYRGKPTPLAQLSRVSKEWYALCSPFLWEMLDEARKILGTSFPPRPEKDAFAKDTVLELLQAWIVEKCDRLESFEVKTYASSKGSCAPLSVLSRRAGSLDLKSLGLTLGKDLLPHRDTLNSIFRHSPNLHHLTFYADYSTSDPSMFTLLDGLTTVRRLTLVEPDPELVQFIRVASQIEQLEFALQDDTPYGDVLKLLGSFSASLKMLVLRQFFVDKGDDSYVDVEEAPLPHLTDFAIYPRDDTLRQLPNFPSPVRNFYLQSCPAHYLDRPLEFLESHANTLRSFRYGDAKISYRTGGGNGDREWGKKELEEMKRICEEKGIEYKLPLLEVAGTVEDDEDDYSGFGWGNTYVPDTGLEWMDMY
ncbi:hypothetical protein JCM10207_002748 [Rhodosporidiobolus poonsookiae]